MFAGSPPKNNFHLKSLFFKKVILLKAPCQMVFKNQIPTAQAYACLLRKKNPTKFKNIIDKINLTILKDINISVSELKHRFKPASNFQMKGQQPNEIKQILPFYRISSGSGQDVYVLWGRAVDAKTLCCMDAH